MFDQLRAHDVNGELRRESRDRLVLMNLDLAERAAARFRGRGEPSEDLLQVAAVGLIEAVERFDAARGVEFRAFAEPTIVGVIKRHFRDRTWLMGVPRRLKQLHRPLDRARAELTQRYGREPTVGELASHLQVHIEDVLQALEVTNAYSALSLDRAMAGNDGLRPRLQSALGVEDAGLDAADNRAHLCSLLAPLPGREKTILFLRFFLDQTETQIAERLDISQAQVSRLLQSSLRWLRAEWARQEVA